MPLNKPLDQITEADLMELIQRRTVEQLTLDYKLILPGSSDNDSKEFVADVSSFANTAGGHLIYGMREDKGEPTELVGIQGDADGAILRLESRIRDGIAPRISGVHSASIKLPNSKWALVIEIPKSFTFPHMVTLGGTSRFYARMSNGRYQMDVYQIRSSVLNSESIASKIRDFRVERITRVRSGETPIPLMDGPYLALHVIPLAAFGSSSESDVLKLESDARTHQSLAPIFQDFADHKRINLDGLVYFRVRDREGRSWGYTQIYRNGIIESVDASFVYSTGPVVQSGPRALASTLFEEGLISAVGRFFGVLRSLSIGPPLVLMLTLIDVKGYTMALGDSPFHHASAPFDREILMIPEILVESVDGNIASILKPIFDSVWNAAGEIESPYYINGVRTVNQNRGRR